MTAGVYAIINTVTGRRYIGSTKNFDQRRQHHLSRIRRGDFYPSRQLLPDIATYGPDAFAVELIETVNADDAALEDAERRWMRHFDETAPGSLYNVDRSARRPFWRNSRTASPHPPASEGEGTP